MRIQAIVSTWGRTGPRFQSSASRQLTRMMPSGIQNGMRCLVSSFSHVGKSNLIPNLPQREHSSTPHPKPAPKTTRSIRASSQPLVMLTAYDFPSGLHAERAGVDIALVGDSLGMVVLGHSTTQPVTLSDMVHHTRAVRRAIHTPLVVSDLPFGSYEADVRDALHASFALVKDGGADAVKLEGASPARLAAVRALVRDAGIAVMGHVGLTPQTVSVAGGFRAVGRNAEDAARVLDGALGLEDAGVFAVVLECVPPQVAKVVTNALTVPTIGIGAGPHCRGQVLVYHDLLGVMAHPHHASVAPKFSKQYAQVGATVDAALKEFCAEVRRSEFPSAKYSPYTIPPSHLDSFQKYAAQITSDDADSGAMAITNTVTSASRRGHREDAFGSDDENVKVY